MVLFEILLVFLAMVLGMVAAGVVLAIAVGYCESLLRRLADSIGRRRG